MFLRHVEIENFRAYENAAFDWPATGLTLVVGANNSGKSALLSAIDVIAGIKPGSSVARSGVNERASTVCGRFSLDETDRKRIFDLEEANVEAWMSTPAFSEIEVGFRVYNGSRMWLDVMSTVGPHGEELVLAKNEIRASDGNFALSSVNLQSVISSGPTALVGLGEAGVNSDAPDWLPNFQLLYPIFQLIAEWRSRVYHFEALRKGADRAVPSRGAATLSSIGDNLPQALLSIMSADDPSWHEIVRVMQDVVPDVGVLAAPVQEAEVEVSFRDPHLNALHNVKDLGTGVEQLLMTVYVGVRQPPGSLIIIEEPETNLHPAAQRALLRYLAEWSKERSFVIATHSTVFLDDRSGPRQVLLVEREQGVASVREATAGLEDVLDAIGVRFSDVLSADRLVLVEGESDASVLRAWFPTLSLSRGVAVAAMQGSDQAYHVDLVAGVLERADRLGRKILVFRDHDELPDAARVRLEATGLVHVLQRRELENYLLEPPAIERVLSRQEHEPGAARSATLDVDALSGLLREAAERLKPVVLLKRVVAELGPQRMIGRADVNELVREGASIDGLLGLIERRVEGAADLAMKARTLWEQEEVAVDAQWDERWSELAPGEELLQAVWSQHGGRFEKGRDGVQIALEMERPPSEVVSVVEAFLSDV